MKSEIWKFSHDEILRILLCIAISMPTAILLNHFANLDKLSFWWIIYFDISIPCIYLTYIDPYVKSYLEKRSMKKEIEYMMKRQFIEDLHKTAINILKRKIQERKTDNNNQVIH